MPVGIDEPPLAIDLLDAEEARRLGLGAGEAAVLAVAELAGVQGLVLTVPLALELLQALDLPRILRWNPLSEFIHHRQLVQDLGAGVVVGKADVANLERGIADRRHHGHCQRLHRLDGAERSHHRHPEGVARLVEDRGQILAFLALALEVAQRHGRANPDASAELVEAQGAHAVGGVEPQQEALGGGRLHFHDQELVRRPVGRQIRVQVFERPLVLGDPELGHQSGNLFSGKFLPGAGVRVEHNALGVGADQPGCGEENQKSCNRNGVIDRIHL